MLFSAVAELLGTRLVGVIALVGAGGKTSALFSLGRSAFLSDLNCALTTTTHIFDPRSETGRFFGTCYILPELAQAEADSLEACVLEACHPRAGEKPAVFASSQAAIPDGQSITQSKLKGIHPEQAAALAGLFDLVVVEADGCRGLPLKAPADSEPVLPASCTLVLGCLGLDSLGKPNDEKHVHRSALFSERSGCAPGSPVRPEHLAALATHPLGLFKDAPDTARRIVLMNKADLVDPAVASKCARLIAEASGLPILVAGQGKVPFDTIMEVLP